MAEDILTTLGVFNQLPGCSSSRYSTLSAESWTSRDRNERNIQLACSHLLSSDSRHIELYSPFEDFLDCVAPCDHPRPPRSSVPTNLVTDALDRIRAITTSSASVDEEVLHDLMVEHFQMLVSDFPEHTRHNLQSTMDTAAFSFTSNLTSSLAHRISLAFDVKPRMEDDPMLSESEGSLRSRRRLVRGDGTPMRFVVGLYGEYMRMFYFDRELACASPRVMPSVGPWLLREFLWRVANWENEHLGEPGFLWPDVAINDHSEASSVVYHISRDEGAGSLDSRTVSDVRDGRPQLPWSAPHLEQDLAEPNTEGREIRCALHPTRGLLTSSEGPPIRLSQLTPPPPPGQITQLASPHQSTTRIILTPQSIREDFRLLHASFLASLLEDLESFVPLLMYALLREREPFILRDIRDVPSLTRRAHRLLIAGADEIFSILSVRSSIPPPWPCVLRARLVTLALDSVKEAAGDLVNAVVGANEQTTLGKRSRVGDALNPSEERVTSEVARGEDGRMCEANVALTVFTCL